MLVYLLIFIWILHPYINEADEISCEKINFDTPNMNGLQACSELQSLQKMSYFNAKFIKPFRDGAEYFLTNIDETLSCGETINTFYLDTHSLIQMTNFLYLNSGAKLILRIVSLENGREQTMYEWVMESNNNEWRILNNTINSVIERAKIQIESSVNDESTFALEHLHIINPSIQDNECQEDDWHSSSTTTDPTSSSSSSSAEGSTTISDISTESSSEPDTTSSQQSTTTENQSSSTSSGQISTESSSEPDTTSGQQSTTTENQSSSTSSGEISTESSSTPSDTTSNQESTTSKSQSSTSSNEISSSTSNQQSTTFSQTTTTTQTPIDDEKSLTNLYIIMGTAILVLLIGLIILLCCMCTKYGVYPVYSSSTMPIIIEPTSNKAPISNVI